MNETKLAVIDGETLMNMRLPSTRFCVQTLLPKGVTVLDSTQSGEGAYLFSVKRK